MIEILSTGLSNSVQDLGRPGHLDQGIGHGGAMDRPALTVANWLVGNEGTAAGLEIGMMPFRLRLETACLVAVTGAFATIELNGVARSAWSVIVAKAGDELRIAPPVAGARAFIAFSGGLDVPKVLGSSATDLKSGFGGLAGRGLSRGDRIALGRFSPATMAPGDSRGVNPSLLRPDAGAALSGPPQRVRIMPGAEWNDFDPRSLERLTAIDWLVTADANRQGLRLDGSPLARQNRRELFSHGIMPGTIQVPPNGLPIIQLADANTCGGYPKIATVIAPDLWRLGQAAPGTRIRFDPVGRSQAIDAMRSESQRLETIKTLIDTMMGRTRKASIA